MLKNQKIGIVGFGLENQQFVKWLLSQEITDIMVFDKNDCTKKALEFGIKNVIWGQNYLQNLRDCDIIFKAPGIYSKLPEFEEFRETGKLVLSSLQYFFDKFGDKIIAVTGTKGKTTTSSLITHLLSKSNKTVHYCGNTTGISPYQFWEEKDAIFVVELSSFQLQDLQNINPKVSVVTNYYLDHQDQHISPQEYWASKDRIFEFQTSDNFSVLNTQISSHSNMQTLAQKILVNQKLVGFVASRVQSPLLGEHNRYNLTIALASVLIFLTGDFDISGLDNSWTTKLQDYKAVEMRLEKFAQNDKVAVYDDGAATEPQAVISAIKALTNNDQKLWLWISGKDKGGDLQELADLIKSIGDRIRVEYCGEVGQNLAKLLGVNCQKQSLKEKLDDLQKLGLGDFEGNICLSPCGSSFDEFDNYKQRSAFWKSAFKSL